jgi:signal transduction histidine kinase/ActR/RegA family two-component response regulator
VCISGRPFFDDRGRFLGYRGVGRNIDAAKQAEAALRKSKEAAEAASLAKSRFMANMSHEIRTPMNGIVGMAELALSMIHDPQLADCVATIKESADSLRRIIDSILDFSKVEAGKLELEHTPFALRALVDSTLKSFTAVARQRELALGWAVPPEVPDALVGDPTRLREILVNLVGNALKFTAVGSVQVQVASQATSSAQTESSCSLAFVVRDTGIGIAADKLEAIFEPFSQADSSTTRKYGGTGLGLTICARLAKLMGGDIGVHSTPGVGSTFRLRLPFERAAAVAAEPRSAAAVAAVTGVSTVAAAAAPPPAAAVPARSLDILLAEDNPVNQIVAEQMLLRAGHRVSIAGNGVEALALLRVREFDLVLMDMQMPEMGGVEAARHLRAIEAGDGRPRTPVIAITANAMDSDRAECLAAGMDDFIAKPVQWAEACRAIERAISASHAAKAPA